MRANDFAITAKIDDGDELKLSHDFSEHEREILLAGGLLSYLRGSESGNGAESGQGVDGHHE